MNNNSEKIERKGVSLIQTSTVSFYIDTIKINCFIHHEAAIDIFPLMFNNRTERSSLLKDQNAL